MADLSSSPIAVKSVAVDAKEMRGLLGGLFASPGLVAVDAATLTGVVTQSSTPGMSVQINPFAMVIKRSGYSSKFQQAVYVSSEEVLDLSIASAPGAGSRTDLVIVRVLDTDLGDATSGAKVEVLTGISIIPDDAELLATIVVASGTTTILNAAITPTPKRAQTYNTALKVATEASRPAASSVPAGTEVLCMDYLSRWISDGTNWLHLYSPVQVGVLRSADKALTNSTQSAVSECVASLAPNATYDVEVWVYAQAPSGNDVAWGVNLPAGAGFIRNSIGRIEPATSVTASSSTTVSVKSIAANVAGTMGTDGTSTSLSYGRGAITTDVTAGTAQLTAALGTGSGSGSVWRGTMIKVTRVA